MIISGCLGSSADVCVFGPLSWDRSFLSTPLLLFLTVFVWGESVDICWFMFLAICIKFWFFWCVDHFSHHWGTLFWRRFNHWWLLWVFYRALGWIWVVVPYFLSLVETGTVFLIGLLRECVVVLLGRCFWVLIWIVLVLIDRFCSWWPRLWFWSCCGSFILLWCCIIIGRSRSFSRNGSGAILGLAVWAWREDDEDGPAFGANCTGSCYFWRLSSDFSGAGGPKRRQRRGWCGWWLLWRILHIVLQGISRKCLLRTPYAPILVFLHWHDSCSF